MEGFLCVLLLSRRAHRLRDGWRVAPSFAASCGDAKRGVKDAPFLFSGLVERHLIGDAAPGKTGSGGSVPHRHHGDEDKKSDDPIAHHHHDESTAPLSPTVFACTPLPVVPLFLGDVRDGVVDSIGFSAPTDAAKTSMEGRVDNRLSFFHTNMEGLLCTNRAANTLHQLFINATADVVASDEKLKDVCVGVAPTAEGIAAASVGASNFAAIPQELWPLLRKSFADTHKTAFLEHNLNTLFAGYFELTIAARTESTPPAADPADNAYGTNGFLQMQGGRYFLDSPEGIFELSALHNTFYDEVLLEAGKQRQTAMRYIKNHKKKAARKAAVLAGEAVDEDEDASDEMGDAGALGDINGMKEFGNKGLERRKRQQEEKRRQREQQEEESSGVDGSPSGVVSGDDAAVSPTSDQPSPTTNEKDTNEPDGMLMSGTTFLGKALVRAWRETMKASHLLYGTQALPNIRISDTTSNTPLSSRPLVHVFVGSDSNGEAYYRSLHLVACAVEAGGRAKLIRTLDELQVAEVEGGNTSIVDADGEQVRILWKACRWDDALRDYALWKIDAAAGSATADSNAIPRLCELLLGAGGRFGAPTPESVDALTISRRPSASGVFVVDPFWVSITARTAMVKYAYEQDPTHFAFQGLNPQTGFSTNEGAPLLPVGEVNAVLQCWVVAQEAGGVTGCEKRIVSRSIEEMAEMGLTEVDYDRSVNLGVGAVKTQRIMYPMRFVHD